MSEQMVSVPLELLRRLHLSHYHTLSHDEKLAVSASQAMDAALVDLYELMAMAMPESDPHKPYSKLRFSNISATNALQPSKYGH